MGFRARVVVLEKENGLPRPGYDNDNDKDNNNNNNDDDDDNDNDNDNNNNIRNNNVIEMLLYCLCVYAVHFCLWVSQNSSF